jgi:hypothetical protein
VYSIPDPLIYEEIVKIGVSERPVFKSPSRLSRPALPALENVALGSSDLTVVKVNDLVMMTPEEVAIIKAEIDRMERARKDCTDSGIRKWIDAVIEKQKEKLASGNNPK